MQENRRSSNGLEMNATAAARQAARETAQFTGFRARECRRGFAADATRPTRHQSKDGAIGLKCAINSGFRGLAWPVRFLPS
jgi:hypothetical protein